MTENAIIGLKDPPVTKVTSLQGRVDRLFISPQGYVLALGWLADEGAGPIVLSIDWASETYVFAPSAVFRTARPDVEAAVRFGLYDFGFVAFALVSLDRQIEEPIRFSAQTIVALFATDCVPERVADRRLLDTLLEVIADSNAHTGREIAVHDFLIKDGGATAINLFQTHIKASLSGMHVERYRPRNVSRSFVTVLFGSTEAIRLQPVLFHKARIDFGEWIYFCNSPELAEEAFRLGKTISDLYDLPITIISVGDNIGFGAANNYAIQAARSDRIILINPDVYPMEEHAALLYNALCSEQPEDMLWGGLLFYDRYNLMHSGMFVERDRFTRRNNFNTVDKSTTSASCSLLRVEHFDKCIPFVERSWNKLKVVPAITGALMVFTRARFELLDGFSTLYIYGHYEDADLSLRWGRTGGVVAVNPALRLVHLEGQGSHAKGRHYHGAALVNRHIFTKAHKDVLTQ